MFYYKDMKSQSTIPILQNALTLPAQDRLVAILGPRALNLEVLKAVAAISLKGEVRVVDAGNRFDAYLVARQVRRMTVAVNPCLERIRLVRPFTCYQFMTALEELAHACSPLIIIEIANLFLDEDVKDADSRRLFEKGMRFLQRYSRESHVVVTQTTGRQKVERTWLEEMIRDYADSVFEYQVPQDGEALLRQVSLFDDMGEVSCG
jgi:hypothetical protein